MDAKRVKELNDQSVKLTDSELSFVEKFSVTLPINELPEIVVVSEKKDSAADRPPAEELPATVPFRPKSSTRQTHRPPAAGSGLEIPTIQFHPHATPDESPEAVDPLAATVDIGPDHRVEMPRNDARTEPQTKSRTESQAESLPGKFDARVTAPAASALFPNEQATHRFSPDGLAKDDLPKGELPGDDLPEDELAIGGSASLAAPRQSSGGQADAAMRPVKTASSVSSEAADSDSAGLPAELAKTDDPEQVVFQIDQRARFSEKFERIARSIESAATDQMPASLAFTAAEPSPSTQLNHQQVAFHSIVSVLATRNPTLRLIAIEASALAEDADCFAPGLGEILDGSHDLEDCVVPSTLDNLDYLAYTPSDHSSAETFRSRSAGILAKLKKHYDMVLISAEAAGHIETNIWCGLADSSYLLLNLQQTPEPVAQQVTAKLRKHGARLAGCILTESA